MDLGLGGKVAIITGGTQGIGRATAHRLVEEGANVVVCARGRDRLDETTDSLRAAGGRVIGVQADVAVAGDCERIVAETVAAFGAIDVLVNNAGTAQTGAFESVTDDTWRSDLDLKLFAAIRLVRLALPRLRASGSGRVINVTNIGGKQPSAGSMPTTVTRAAGLAMTKAMSKEFAPDGVLVNAVCIGLVRAGQHEARAVRKGQDLESLYRDMARGVPLGRVGEAREAADVIVFLASRMASFVTGTSINVDGGASAVL